MKAGKHMGKALENPWPPLFLRYPHIPRTSIGWRMGYGEAYSLEFSDWYKTLSKNEKQQYQIMFPEPRNWLGHYQNGVELWNECGEPHYSREWLINQSMNSEYLFFWQTGDIEHDPECCFSQWQYSEFNVGHVEFTCTEQYMMVLKARIFDDEEIENKIMKTSSPKQMKSLGRKVRNFNSKVWDKLKHSVVLNGNYYKFTQNKKMRDVLLATDGKVLVEASPLDTIWGIGYGKDNPNATDPRCWRGSNLLGFALMELRDELKRVYQNYDRINWSLYD